MPLVFAIRYNAPMNYLTALLLSIIEGITEFLPISSTGHLILVSRTIGIGQTDFVKSFEIFIQFGAILAVLTLYSNTLLRNWDVWKRILTAFLPTATIGFILYKMIKEYLLGNATVVLGALFIGGIILILLEMHYQEKEHHLDDIKNLDFKKALAIGIFQSISVIPGVSRAAATIIGGLFMGLKRKTAVEFSFLLAIPTMFAATILDLSKSNLSFSSTEFALLGVGFIGAFLSATFTVKYFIRFVSHHTFIPFGIYRIILTLTYWYFVFR